MKEGYTIKDQEKPHFITFKIVELANTPAVNVTKANEFWKYNNYED